MGFYSYFRISKPSVGKVPEAEVSRTYRRLRSQTFWGVTVAYSLFYVCRMAMSVVKQPLIDDGIHNLEGGEYRKILFTRPYNLHYDAEANGMIRVHTWDEIAAIIDNMAPDPDTAAAEGDSAG